MIELHHAVAFMQKYEQPKTRRRANESAADFYLSLLYWTIRGKLSLRFIHPVCHKSLDDCRCATLGEPASDAAWSYFEDVRLVRHWQIDKQSLLQLPIGEIYDIHPRTSEKLRGFIVYVRSL
jgi:hypothetical protein